MIKTKNLMLAFVAIFMLVMTVYSASALDRPLAIDPNSINLFGPIAPSSDAGGACNIGSLKNEYCGGEVHHYDLCVRTAAGGAWDTFSEVCTDYSPNVHCLANKCVKQESILSSVLILAGIVLVLIIIWKLIKKRK